MRAPGDLPVDRVQHECDRGQRHEQHHRLRAARPVGDQRRDPADEHGPRERHQVGGPQRGRVRPPLGGGEQRPQRDREGGARGPADRAEADRGSEHGEQQQLRREPGGLLLGRRNRAVLSSRDHPVP
ncbi:hypothetical protein GCM10017566_02290 [Amycolatopsis bartoniae]|uniref:Uncharacterized protein n=1 Tax=Amycolatopsis bartoniae TaxID=941986 RepID=A0A8H9IQG3_9PSEU|nr:hypothetical protein GCM10017566_02290 [Amycolatopsis bartoniae]